MISVLVRDCGSGPVCLFFMELNSGVISGVMELNSGVIFYFSEKKWRSFF